LLWWNVQIWHILFLLDLGGLVFASFSKDHYPRMTVLSKGKRSALGPFRPEDASCWPCKKGLKKNKQDVPGISPMAEIPLHVGVCTSAIVDDLVKSRNSIEFVIPAKAAFAGMTIQETFYETILTGHFIH